MNSLVPSLADWAGQTLLAGGVVFAVGWVGLRIVREPARRQRLGAWTVRAAVLAAVLGLLPGWWTVRVPEWASASQPMHIVSQPVVAHPIPPDLPKIVERADVGGIEEPVAVGPGWNVKLLPVEEQPRAAALRGSSAETTRGAERAPVEDPGGWTLPALMIYFVFALIAIAQYALGALGLARWRKHAVPAPPRVRAIVDDLAAQHRHRPRVLVSPCVPSPVCFGVLAPTILLPTNLAKTASPAELRWVLAHEFDHLRRGDTRTGLWVGLARAVYFAVPWFWAVRRDLRLAQEYLADAAAAGDRTADYAEFLVTLSGRPAPHPLAATGVRAGRSDLFRRVSMLTQSKPVVPGRWSRLGSTLAACGVLCSAVALSGASLAADPPKPAKIVEIEVTDEAPKPPKAAEPKPAEPKKVATADTAKKILAEIDEAVKKGDVEAVRKLVAKLEAVKARTVNLPVLPALNLLHGVNGAVTLPPGVSIELLAVPLGDMAPHVFHGVIGNAGKPTDGKLEALRKAAAEVKDNPEAKAALDRAIAEYEKKMAEAPKPPAVAEIPRGNADAKFMEQHMEAHKNELLALQTKHAQLMAMAKQVLGKTNLSPAGTPRFGVVAEPLPEALIDQLDLQPNQRMLVKSVVAESVAAKAGVKPNDILIQMDGIIVPADVASFSKLIADLKANEKLKVAVIRKGKREVLAASLPEAKKAAEKIKDDGPAFSEMAVSVNNDIFKVSGTSGDNKYVITGKIADGKATPVRIDINEHHIYELQAVAGEHLPAVKKLLRSVNAK